MNCSVIVRSAGLSVLLAALTSSAVTVSVGKVQQRYPWNGLVDIDSTVVPDDPAEEQDPINDRLEVSVTDLSADPPAVRPANSFLQAPLPTSAGRHRITWNAWADGLTGVVPQFKVTMGLKHCPVRYLVVDISAGLTEEPYPVTYMSAPPPGGFTNDLYRTDRLVLRLIHPRCTVVRDPMRIVGVIRLAKTRDAVEGRRGDPSVVDTVRKEIPRLVHLADCLDERTHDGSILRLGHEFRLVDEIEREPFVIQSPVTRSQHPPVRRGDTQR